MARKVAETNTNDKNIAEAKQNLHERMTEQGELDDDKKCKEQLLELLEGGDFTTRWSNLLTTTSTAATTLSATDVLTISAQFNEMLILFK